MTETDPALDQLADEINVRLKKADENEGKARDHRIAAGLRLKEARALILPGQWGAWLSENIERSRQDIYKCLALVRSNDPTDQRRARSQERAKVREQVQRSRASAKTVAYVCDKSASADPPPANNPIDAIKGLAALLADPLEVIQALVLDLGARDLERCKAWFLAHPAIIETSPRVEVDGEQSPASSVAPHAKAPRPGDANASATVSPPTAQQLQTQPDPLGVPTEAANDSGSAGAPLELPPDIAANEPTLPQIEGQKHRRAAPAGPIAPAWEPSDDGGLMPIWEGLKKNPRVWARWWIEADFPDLGNYRAQAHFDLAVLAPFCATTRTASPEQIQRFMQLSAEQPQWAARA